MAVNRWWRQHGKFPLKTKRKSPKQNVIFLHVHLLKRWSLIFFLTVVLVHISPVEAQHHRLLLVNVTEQNILSERVSKPSVCLMIGQTR